MRNIRSGLPLCALLVTWAHSASSLANDNTEDAPGEATLTDLQLSEEELAAAEAGEIIVLQGEKAYIPVASRSVRDRDIALRPHPRPADILRVVPGLFVNQHAGGGKANQYFLRGFDADHGTDIALSVDGIPANMVSHGHGQGYADLNWMIPELVQSVDTFKGPYSALLGDFVTAGSVDMRLVDAPKKSSVSITGGQFDTGRALAILQGGEVLGGRPMVAAEAYHSNGPFDNGEGLRRFSAHSQFLKPTKSGQLKVAATSYGADWNGSGQLPLREVRAGRLDRFGSVDPTEGGASQRHSLYATYHGYRGENAEVSAMAYLVRYRFTLFSNFTFFSAKPDVGDQIEQEDDRWYGGVRTSYRFRSMLGTLPLLTTVGAQTRADTAATGLFDAVARERGAARVDARISQARLGAFVQEDILWTPWLRTITGLRVDGFAFDVNDNLGGESGQEFATELSPKMSVVVSPTKTTDVYLNSGFGFHSNDARALVRETNAGTPLTQATGYEVGARTTLMQRVDLASSLWLLDLSQETVWVGDEGVTEARGATRRFGVEVEARVRLLDWLTADGDLTVSRARFVDAPEGEDRIPLAPKLTLTGGLSALRKDGLFGRLGIRTLSDRPLTEDGFLVADGFTLLDATVGYRTPAYAITLAVDNLLNTEWREAQFASTSRVQSEASTTAPAPPGACPSGTRAEEDGGNFVGCEDVHFTPGAPLNAMVTVQVFF